MSHFVTINTQIRDIEALQDACAELGIELLQDTEARGYSTNKMKGDYVIRLNGPYDIALNRQKDGENDNTAYGLTTDWWNGHVEKEVGPNFGRLLQFYGVHKTMHEARAKRLKVRRRQETDGTIRLSIGGV